MLIAGNFSEYPFSLLLEIFLLRRETGLLEVSSSEEPGYFYIKNGKIKDGQIGKSKGVAAVNVASKLNDGFFRFKRLEAAEYARVVWQRRFGPTGPAIGQLPIPAQASEIGNRIRQLTELALRQLQLYRSIANRHLQKIAAQVEARIRRLAEDALAAHRKRQRDRQLRPRYPRKVSLQLPTVSRSGAITAALQQGVEHNVIFAFTLTILLGVSGLMLYQLVFVNQESTDTGFTIDEHFDISPSTARPPVKPKRQRKRERAFISHLREAYADVPILILRRVEVKNGDGEIIRGEFVLSDQSHKDDLALVEAVRKIFPIRPCQHTDKELNFDTVRNVMRIIADNYADPDLDLEKVASSLPISPVQLSHILNQKVGVSFRHLLRHTRIEEAKRLLASHRYSVKEVAVRVGFADSHYFSRTFKELTGQSATEYRSRSTTLSE